jgi:hypothetical protein
MQFLEWLEMTSYAVWVRESLWGWAIMLTIHAYGNAIVVGVIFIIALRLLGFFRTIPYTSLNKSLTPLIWCAVVMQVISGFSLFLTKPPRYATDPMFLTKMAFLIAGIFLTFHLQKILRAEAAGWRATQTVSKRGTQIAALAALAWACVLIMGRLTAYLGQLYDVV